MVTFPASGVTMRTVKSASRRCRLTVCTPVTSSARESAAFLSHFDALAGAETFVDIALFGVKKRELLRRFLPFTKGMPSHDHLGDFFATLDAECFQHWERCARMMSQGPDMAAKSHLRRA